MEDISWAIVFLGVTGSGKRSRFTVTVVIPRIVAIYFVACRPLALNTGGLGKQGLRGEKNL